MKPVIGVTANYEEEKASLKHEYCRCITQAGGIPLIVPFSLGTEDIRQIGGTIDGLLLTGGPDIDPDCYGEQPLPALGAVTPERDRLELELIRECVRLGKPILAICRGHQVLNVALGGSLYQDVYTQCKAALQHSQKAPRSHLSHKVRVEPGTLLHRIAGASEFKVNSFHHQAVKRPAPGLLVTARAEDGIVEAIESAEHPFVVGVQWHPEDTAATDAVSGKLFAAFVEACSKRQP